MIQETPLIAQESMDVGAKWGQKVMDEMEAQLLNKDSANKQSEAPEVYKVETMPLKEK